MESDTDTNLSVAKEIARLNPGIDLFVEKSYEGGRQNMIFTTADL